MGNWSVTIYDSVAAAETALETMDSTVLVHIVAFKDGAKQKVMVAQAT